MGGRGRIDGRDIRVLRVTLCAGEGQDLRTQDGRRAMHFAEMRQGQLCRSVSSLPITVGRSPESRRTRVPTVVAPNM
jgi:hypothetical protein